ncbi:MAG: uracil-DNA glycosylase [Myxococcales bacterium]|nr:uracil-DNA glycosylase [Myxococcales bacterium]
MEDTRAELAKIAAALRAHLEVQQASGATGVPRGTRGGAGRAPDTAARAGATISASTSPATSTATSAAAPVTAPAAGTTAETGAPAGAAAASAAGDRRTKLDVLASEVAGCTKCGLAATRTQTVFSRGNPGAAICFVGEAPGADEDAQGLPFVGRAGQLLDRMIAAMGLSPERDVYVCNILKCRPPGNRRPEPEEIATCIPYLHEQLAVVRPRVIVAMGNTAVFALLDTKLGITRVRGQWKLYRGQTLVMPTYHPSYLLRPGPAQTEAKRQAWEDLKLVMKELGLPIPPRAGEKAEKGRTEQDV